LIVGVDIGGTKIATGLVDATGRILFQTRCPMVGNCDAAAGLAAVISAIDAVQKEASEGLDAKNRVRGIGICAPGPLDPNTGVVVNPPNLSCWRNFPLVEEVARFYGLPVKLDNDGNAAALAEFLWGAGRGFRNIFYATLGTGVGTGIVLDGKLYHGRTGAAAEGGHVSIDYKGPRCGCGKLGCIEVFASGPAIAKRARAKLQSQQGVSSKMLDLSGGDLARLSSEIVGTASAAGDRLAREVLLEIVDLLALWLGNMVDLLEPDVLIIGGGVAAMLNPFFPEIRNRLPSCCINSRCQEIPLLPAHYGQDAGVAGGAALLFQAESGVRSAFDHVERQSG
jgi:glucokinase